MFCNGLMDWPRQQFEQDPDNPGRLGTLANPDKLASPAALDKSESMIEMS